MSDFWQSKLVTCRLLHAAWKKLLSEKCPGFVLKRSGTEQRLAAGQHLHRLMVHQPFLVAGTLWLNDINVFSESQESASRIKNLCYSINISSCFMNLSELPKKREIASLCFDVPKTAAFQHKLLTHSFSQLAVALFDVCKLRLWLKIILYYLLETSLLLKSCTTRLQFLHTKFHLLLLHLNFSKNKWTGKTNIITAKR